MMGKWFERLGLFLLVIFGLLYVGAKIHFFTRYGVLSPGEYVEELWYFWAGMATISGVGVFLGWIRKRFERPKSN